MDRVFIVFVDLRLVNLLPWILERVLDAINLVAKTVGLAEKLGGCRPHHGKMALVVQWEIGDGRNGITLPFS